jgi:hypothetical protein
MPLTGRAQFKSANLNTGVTPVSATGNGTAVAMPDVQEALLILDCTVITGAGVVGIVVQYSPDGGATFGTATGGTFANVTTAGTRQAVHITGLGSHTGQIRLAYTLVSGTSVNIVVEMVGFQPMDSANVADQI